MSHIQLVLSLLHSDSQHNTELPIKNTDQILFVWLYHVNSKMLFLVFNSASYYLEVHLSNAAVFHTLTLLIFLEY